MPLPSRSSLLTDDSGYCPTRRVLDFLAVSEADIDELVGGSSPLGVSRDDYEAFKDSLDSALKADDIHDADIRLQGSSVRFFSGRHKRMPLERGDVLEVFLDLRRRSPDRAELDRIMAEIDNLWPERDVPARRPFDSLWKLRIDRYPSDVDAQVSSDAIAERAKAHVAGLGFPLESVVVENEKYAFIRKEYVAEVAPALTSWALRQSDVLPRPVTVAVFSASGPPKTDGPLSSHFKDDDWRVFVGGGGE